MKSFLAWIKGSPVSVLRKGFRFLFRAFFRLFWLLFRTGSFVIGAIILTLVLIAIVGYWILGDRIERTVWQQQKQFGFRLDTKDEQGRPLRPFSSEDKGYLKLDLTQLSDQWATPSTFLPLLDRRGGGLNLVTLLETLEHAAKNDNISAIAITTSGTMAQLGVAGVEDLRKAIERFRAQGKIAWIYTTNMGGIGAGSGLKSYYLASTFDQITLAPSGNLGFGGVRIELPYFRNALDKLQISPEFEAREAYKSFPQQFLNSSISEAVEENLQGMADGVVRQWSKEVERTRRLDSEIVSRSLASPYINASDAQLRGLVDRIAYPDAFWSALHDTLKARALGQDLTEEAKVRSATNAIPFLAYASYHRLGQFFDEEDDPRHPTKLEVSKAETKKEADSQATDSQATDSEATDSQESSTEPSEAADGEELAREEEEETVAATEAEADGSETLRVALISWRGQIVRTLPRGQWEDGRTISARRATSLLRRLLHDDSFHAVVLHIDSPGGDYIASDQIYHELRRLGKKKPVAVVMGDIAASGGYFIAMAGERIFAQPLTVTGSIGVFAGKIATRDFWQRWGIDWSVVQSGGESTIHSLLDNYTGDDLIALSDALDTIYADFTGKVAQTRDLDTARVEGLAGGRVWLGEQAVANGLVDALGGFMEAKAWIATRLRRPQENILFLPYPRESWSFRLRHLLQRAIATQAHSSLREFLPLDAQEQAQAARLVAPLLSRRGTLSAPYILLMP